MRVCVCGYVGADSTKHTQNVRQEQSEKTGTWFLLKNANVRGFCNGNWNSHKCAHTHRDESSEQKSAKESACVAIEGGLRDGDDPFPATHSRGLIDGV